jgi:hypothetical protein
MPQLPDLINLAIPGFIGLLLLEAVLDAIMRRELYQLKDTAARPGPAASCLSFSGSGSR